MTLVTFRIYQGASTVDGIGAKDLTRRDVTIEDRQTNPRKLVHRGYVYECVALAKMGDRG